ncbi:MAG: hypothetical protein FJW23_10835 [Acidimicrobiia bacterium]|nr:hypothetical protein [Acidimicrobiia bacterium]
MRTVFPILLILHFLGLAMGFGTSFANMVMGGLIDKAAPGEKPVLARFPPAMIRVGDTGLILLWTTGLIMLYTKWGGFGNLPWQFHAKITAVAVLSGVIGYIHVLMKKARQGDQAAMARIPAVGKVAFLMAATALVLAVITFN